MVVIQETEDNSDNNVMQTQIITKVIWMHLSTSFKTCTVNLYLACLWVVLIHTPSPEWWLAYKVKQNSSTGMTVW